jgi:hypothetical protein
LPSKQCGKAVSGDVDLNAIEMPVLSGARWSRDENADRESCRAAGSAQHVLTRKERYGYR